MGKIGLRDGAVDERQPLLRQQSPELYETHQQTLPSRWKITWQSIIPSFDVVSPRYRFVPLLGCLIILFHECEAMFTHVAMTRAIEALHCLEYYEQHNSDLAKLGKNIPEVFCKTDEIQKHVATTGAFLLFVRMLCSMIGVYRELVRLRSHSFLSKSRKPASWLACRPERQKDCNVSAQDQRRVF